MSLIGCNAYRLVPGCFLFPHKCQIFRYSHTNTYTHQHTHTTHTHTHKHTTHTKHTHTHTNIHTRRYIYIYIFIYIYIGLFISPSGISKIDCTTTKTDTAERSISMDRESLQVFVQPHSCSLARVVDFWGLLTKASRTRSTVSANGPGRPLRFAAHRQPATLLKFLVPLTNCLVCRWFCVVHDPKPPLHRHN